VDNTAPAPASMVTSPISPSADTSAVAPAPVPAGTVQPLQVMVPPGPATRPFLPFDLVLARTQQWSWTDLSPDSADDGLL
jgi:hypothetical protein